MKRKIKQLIPLIFAFVALILGCNRESNVIEITGNVIIKWVEYDFFGGGDTLRTEDAEGMKIVLFEGRDSIATTFTERGTFSFENISPGTYYAEAIIADSIKDESEVFIAEAGQTVFCPDIIFDPYPTTYFWVEPNPFYTSVNFLFNIFITASVTLKIYDTKGEDETLLESSLSPGIHQIVWYGPDSTSAFYPSGNYFATLSINDSLFYIINVVKEE